MFIDVHAHLTHPLLLERLDKVIEVSRVVGVEVIVTCGLGRDDCLKALSLRRDGVLVSLGVEPYELDDYEIVLELVYNRAKEVDLIGEVGLDLYRSSREELPKQVAVFKEFIRAASELDKPLVVHSRSAGREALRLLMEEGVERVIAHAYDGPINEAVKASKKGFMFSIPPKIAISEQKRQLVRKLPLENLLLESDSPFLAPARGVINEPKNVSFSVEWISRLKSVSPEKVTERLYENARELLEL